MSAFPSAECRHGYHTACTGFGTNHDGAWIPCPCAHHVPPNRNQPPAGSIWALEAERRQETGQ